ncbi:MAG: hypothetical protein SFX73_35640 [Kofleriaceae bacterium]|nr:hypothetical protein [Kofleriaceae bacterium]
MTIDEKNAARHALACVSHELTGPLSALYTYLRLEQAGNTSSTLTAAVRCADRLRDITATLQAVAHVRDTIAERELGLALIQTAATLGHRLELASTRTVRATQRLELAASLAITAIARSAADGALLAGELQALADRVRVWAWVDGKRPSTWQVSELFGGTRPCHELWLATLTVAAAGGQLHTATVDGVLAVALELPGEFRA